MSLYHNQTADDDTGPEYKPSICHTFLTQGLEKLERFKASCLSTRLDHKDNSSHAMPWALNIVLKTPYLLPPRTLRFSWTY